MTPEVDLTLFTGCRGLLLAVSGGPDSMAMLHRLSEEKFPFPLRAVHVNHGLRPESAKEEALVEEYCKTLSVPCRIFRTDVNREMQKGETVESAARRLRYGFFRQAAEEWGCTHIATAHTKDDQCETVLLHLLHGAGPKGLCGIPPLRREGDRILVRPLLDLTKGEILAYCESKNVPYALDRSNEDECYTRNKIRLRLLPEMEKINPNVRDALCRTAESLRMAQAAAEERANAFLDAHPDGLPVAELRALPEGERAEILRAGTERLGKILSFEQTAQGLALLKKESGTVEFDRKYRLHLGQGRLTFAVKQDPLPEIPVTDGETPLPDGRILRLTPANRPRPEKGEGPLQVSLPALLSPRKEGDRMATPGGTKTLKKRMNEVKIPQPGRDRLWVLRDGDGIAWCEGLGVDEKRKTTPPEGYFITLTEQ